MVGSDDPFLLERKGLFSTAFSVSFREIHGDDSFSKRSLSVGSIRQKKSDRKGADFLRPKMTSVNLKIKPVQTASGDFGDEM